MSPFTTKHHTSLFFVLILMQRGGNVPRWLLNQHFFDHSTRSSRWVVAQSWWLFNRQKASLSLRGEINCGKLNFKMSLWAMPTRRGRRFSFSCLQKSFIRQLSFRFRVALNVTNSHTSTVTRLSGRWIIARNPMMDYVSGLMGFVCFLIGPFWLTV